MQQPRVRLAVIGLLIALIAATTAARPANDVLRVDLGPLIDKAAGDRDRFAVDIAHRVSSRRDGEWTTSGDTATWHYRLRIPTAVSIAFHASRVALPAGATLSVSAAGETYRYTQATRRVGEFWSRLGRGDTLDLTVTVERRLQAQLLVEIASVQAGYRSLIPGVADHPRYRRMQPMAASGTSSCTENYECHLTTGDQGPGQATVALIIGNAIQCTGTLLNDVAGDGAPFVLTARHCESGKLGGGNPAAASSVVAYWDSTTICGQPNASIFSSATTAESGATTVVEQQDAWLIRLDGQPPWDAYFAGWDASGTAVSGGYSIHHAGALTKQFVAWSGTAALATVTGGTLGVGYSSNFVDTVNAVGSINHGASGGGLFSPANLLVGSLTLGANQCPVPSPPAPTAANADGSFTSLAAVYAATGDATSTTGAATIAGALDPARTGVLSVAGTTGSSLPVTLTASAQQAQATVPVWLYWTSQGAQSCAATGGIAGDGWNGGATSLNGSLAVTSPSGGSVTYTITCTNGTRAGQAQVTINWIRAPLQLTLSDATPQPIYAGAPNTLTWSSNLTSCVPSGGTPGDGWAGTQPPSGSLVVTETVAAIYNYTLTCSDAAQTVQSALTVAVQPVVAAIQTDTGGMVLLVGQPLGINWSGTGGCRASGGAVGDGWAGSLTGSLGFVDLTETAAGTYTYGISCGPVAQPVTALTTATFTAGTPTATLTANPTQEQTISGGPVTEIPSNLSWSANVRPCAITSTGPGGNGTVVSNWPAQGAWLDLESIAGLYTYTLTCGTGAAQATSTATINWTEPTPNVQLSVGAIPQAIVGVGTALNWSTNVLPCTATGGTAGDGWGGSLTPNPYNPSVSVTESAAGTYTYTLTCGNGPYGTAQATLVFNNAGGSQLSMTSSPAATYAGRPFTLTWTSAVSPCTAYGGASGDGWAGPRPASGSATLTEANMGALPFALVCGSGTQAVEVSTVLPFDGAPHVTTIISGNQNPPGQPSSVTWQGVNATSCTASGGIAGDGWAGAKPVAGTFTFTPTAAGTATYTLTCTDGYTSDTESTTLAWAPLPPAVSLSASAAGAPVGTPVTLTWTSQNAVSCTASGSNAGDGWSGPEPLNGQTTVTETGAGTVSYMLSCIGQAGATPSASSATVQVTFAPPPTVTISATPNSVSVGQQFTVSWSAVNAASCTASGNNTWSGALPTSGAETMTLSSAGAYTFVITCSNGAATSVTAQASVTATTRSSPATSGGKGGGGAFGAIELVALLAVPLLRRRAIARAIAVASVRPGA